MLNSNLVKQAHKMAKEIKAQFPNVNYHFQFGLCMSYLLNKEEEVVMELPQLTGTEKQVKWAGEIRTAIQTISTKRNLEHVTEWLNRTDSASLIIEYWKDITSKYKTENQKFEMLWKYNCQLSLLKDKKGGR